MADYVTKKQLEKFTQDLENYVVQTLQNEEIEYSKVIKEYIESKLSDLESSIINSEDWAKVKATVDALLQVFDSDTDGSLTPEEVLSKIGELKASINAIADRVTTLEGKVDNINTTIGGIQTDVSGLKDSVAANAQAIENAKSDLQNAIDQTKSDVEAEIASTAESVKQEINNTINVEITNLDQKVGANISDLFNAMESAMASAFENAKNTVCDRMNSVRNVFGLSAQNCQDNTSSDNNGDGATL